MPDPRTGALSFVMAYNGVSLRVTMQYDINVGGMVVNLDMLAGVTVLDENLMAVVQG